MITINCLYISATGNQNKINIQLAISMMRKMIKFFVTPIPQREDIQNAINLVNEIEAENAEKYTNMAVTSISLLGQ